jgi:hypothetical protein
MATFTNEQVTFIEWLSQDNHIEVCIEICPDLGKMIGYESFAGNFQKFAIFKFMLQGSIAEKSQEETIPQSSFYIVSRNAYSGMCFV